MTSNAVDSKDLEELTTQHELAAAWAELTNEASTESSGAKVHVVGSIEEAVTISRNLASPQVEVLVTGSLHLVGGVICLLGLAV